MAVRNDFTAGEVLAAADLNDTFASKLPYSYGTATPSTTDSGFLWYDSNSTPAAPKFWDGSTFATLAPAPGLELVGSDTFTSVSSATILGLFSGDYLNYRLIFSASRSTTAFLRLQLANAGGTSSASYYSSIAEVNSNADTFTFTRVSNGVGADTSNSSGGLRFIVDVSLPNENTSTSLTGWTYTLNTAENSIMSIVHNASYQATGLTIATSSGTITGDVRSYGYKN